MTRIPKHLLVLVFLLAFSVCRSQSINVDTLQGAWKLKLWLRSDEGAMKEEAYPIAPDDNVWIFKGDSLFRYYYPFELIGKQSFRIDSSALLTDGNRYPFVTLALDSGILKVNIQYSLICYFERTSVNEDSMKVIDILNRHDINPGKLLCNFYLVTHFEPDDEAAYDFKAPIKIPAAFSFKDSAEVLQAYSSGIIYLKAGRKMRPFHISEIRWENSFYEHRSEFYSVTVPELILYPGDWWQGEMFEVIYRASEKELAKRKSK